MVEVPAFGMSSRSAVDISRVASALENETSPGAINTTGTVSLVPLVYSFVALQSHFMVAPSQRRVILQTSGPGTCLYAEK